MKFNPAVVIKRDRYLDTILELPQLISAALTTMEITGISQSIPRTWNPGGGSTLFRIKTATNQYFMKVKHTTVAIESRLEKESQFMDISALKNEYNFLVKYRNSPHVPKIINYLELSGYSFLVLEELLNFDDAIAKFTPEELVETYWQLEKFIQTVFNQGDIHTDLHEKNIMFRDKTPVVIDWEGARHLPQTTNFTDSLDVKGYNYLGNTGQTPLAVPNMVPGHPCLNKLKKVFQNRLKIKINNLIDTAAYNSTTGICRTLEHGPKTESYQTINLPGINIPGQRSTSDWRLWVVKYILTILWGKQSITYVDIGSNLGTLTRAIGKLNFVKNSIGVEGTPTYNRLARLLNFIDGNDKVVFLDLICGQDDIVPVLTSQSKIVYGMLSVYHHIEQTDHCLHDLATGRPIGLIAELATQPECYRGKHWQQALNDITTQLGLPYAMLVGYSADYHRPLIVLSTLPYTMIQKLQLQLVREILWWLSWGQRLGHRFVR